MRTVRVVATALVLLLAASAPGCLMPELIVDDGSSSGGGGSDDLGGASSGGSESDGDSGGQGSDGSTGGSGGSDGSGGSADSGGSSTGGGGGGDSGGAGSGGDGSGGASSGGNGSGGEPPLTAYYESGNMHGFVAPIVDYGTIDPAEFDVTADAPYCVAGTIQPQEEYLGFAGWTWNLNQEPNCSGSGCAPPAETFTPTQDGLVFSLDNTIPTTSLRAVIWGPDGAENGNDRWCSELGTASGLVYVPWTAFNTRCWDGAGNDYANEPLTLLRVQANGLGPYDYELPFDFCVELVAESDAPAAGCSPSDGPGVGNYSLAGDESQTIVRAGRSYVVSGDLWASDDTQVIEGTGTTFEVTSPAASGSEAFPAVFIGDIRGTSTLTPNMPRSVNSTEQLLTTWDWTGAFGQSVAALELRFSASANASNPPSSYLEIWVDGATGINPIGTAQGTVNVDSMTWNVYYGMTAGVPIVTFKAATPPASFSADLQDFIDVADSSSWITGSFVTSVAAGFELFGGTGTGLVSTDLCIVP